MVMANVESGTPGLASTFQASPHIVMEASLNRKSRGWGEVYFPLGAVARV